VAIAVVNSIGDIVDVGEKIIAGAWNGKHFLT